MLKNSNEETTGLLLREIVSYCNMMLRNTVEGYDKNYYDPLLTVKEIEALITSKEVQNEELKKIINSSSQKNDENQEKINKLELEIKRIEKMHEILHNKMRDFYKKNKKDLKDISKSLNDDFIKNKKSERKRLSHITTFTSPIGMHKSKNLFNKESGKRKEKYKYYINNLNVDFSQGIQQLVEHANRLFFYQAHLNIKPREIGVYIKAQKRMNQKLKRLKKLEQNNDKFSSVEKAAVNTVNTHIDNLLTELKSLCH